MVDQLNLSEKNAPKMQIRVFLLSLKHSERFLITLYLPKTFLMSVQSCFNSVQDKVWYLKLKPAFSAP